MPLYDTVSVTKNEKTESDLKISLKCDAKIGNLSLEERKTKVSMYLAKRKKRSWHKKISYACRRRVAEKRLRIKGRFASKEQAQMISMPIKNKL